MGTNQCNQLDIPMENHQKQLYPFLKDLDHIPENVEFIKDQKYLLKIDNCLVVDVTKF